MRSSSTALLAALLLALPLGASALTIDDFSATNQSVMIASGPPTPQTQASAAAAPEALGGSREIVLSRNAGFGIAAADANLTGDGLLSVSTAAAVSAVTTLVYDGGADGDVSPGGLGGVDLTDAGASSILRVIARSDLNASVRVQVHSGSATDFLFAVLPLPGSGSGSGPFSVLDIPLSALSVNGAGADLTNVGAVVVLLEGPASVDLQVDSIATVVPEPASLVLMGLGVAGLGLAGRRRA